MNSSDQKSRVAQRLERAFYKRRVACSTHAARIFFACLIFAWPVRAFTPLTEPQTREVLHQLEIAQDAEQQARAEKNAAQADNERLKREAKTGVVNLDSATVSINGVQVDGRALQNGIDDDKAKIAALTIEERKQAHAKWKWCGAFFGLAALVIAFFVARQYFPFLKLI